jgi:regulator of protease activity HflC (stomatin/prohibitin superfamily)
MMLDYLTYAAIALLVIIFLSQAIRILREYERGVVFTLGRFTGVKGPGLIILIPVVQQIVKVDLRVMVQVVPPQDVISRDNVSVKVNAVLYFRIVDPERAIIKVGDYMAATSQLAQTTLRSVLGKHELDEMLAERDRSRRSSTSRPTSGASRSPQSRSRISTSTKPWCARSPSRPRRNDCDAPK